MSQLSEACNTISAVVTTNYTPKGTYTQVGDLKTYIIGPSTATKAILDIYDIFGLAPQTLQGADRLSTSLNCLVLVPDFFKGEPAQYEWFPDDTEEKKAGKTKFMTTRINFEENLVAVLKVTREAKKMFPGVKGWGAFGLCWGGKLAAMASGPETPFTVSGQAHPARLAKKDASAMTIPHICLASPGEPADVVKEYAEVLSSKGYIGEVETYGKMFHGWMGARCDLENPNCVKEFERGYIQVAKFFSKYL